MSLSYSVGTFLKAIPKLISIALMKKKDKILESNGKFGATGRIVFIESCPGSAIPLLLQGDERKGGHQSKA